MARLVLIESAENTPLARVLAALGVIFERRSLAQALAFPKERAASTAVILSEEELVKSVGVDRNDPTVLKALLAGYRHALLYPFRGTARGLQTLSECAEGRAEVLPVTAGDKPRYSVATGFAAAGPFAGLDVEANGATTDRRLLIRESPYAIDHIVSAGDGGLLTKITFPLSELFVISSSAVFDVEAEMTKNLDVRACFSELVPLLFFLRHSQAAFWRASFPAANVIIDDLNLRPNYGFVNAHTLAGHVEEFGYSVSVAFIPWNCNRASRDVIELFRARSPRLSLAIDGCDHVGAEFSTSSVSDSVPMIALSLDRMQSLKTRTGLGYDRVMVFPQGRFSLNAMAALRQSEFIGAVNTELVDDLTHRGVRAQELLMPAITSFAGFPLFMRRKAHEPIANFALDLLLGKPCLVVTHHHDFQRGMQPFAALVASLNALDARLQWTNLETIVSRTYSIRTQSASSVDIRLFASTTALESQDGGTEISFSKAEPLADKDFEIVVAGQVMKSDRDGSDIVFRQVLTAAESPVVNVQVSPIETGPLPIHTLTYRTRVAARRYLSEIRDNHVARSPWATAAMRSTRQVLNGSAFTRRPARHG